MNNIETLRKHLFQAIEGLQDRENPLEIERAKAVAEIAQVIINSAKVEVEHQKIAGGTGTGFLNAPGSTTHRLGG